ncbi:SemD/SinC family type III secretion system effector [Chlamydia buteonis]|uniref:SemD/SinC family type III secretion system effector n=1 Tax=Chlamydia buteonis TaxID=2494525 RepID=UPI00344D70E6
MGINPSGHSRNNNDLWISGAHNQHEDVQNAGKSPSGVVGSHDISTQNNTNESSSFLSKITSAVRNFFSSILGSSSSIANSRESIPTPSVTSSHQSSEASYASSMDISGWEPDTMSVSSFGSVGSSEKSYSSLDSARSTEGAARRLQKKGYTPGLKVDTPKVPDQASGPKRPNTPPPPPPTSSSVRTSLRGVNPASSVTKSSTSQTASGSSTTRSLKRKAPQPPAVGPTKPKLQRQDSTSSISSSGSNDSGASSSSVEISSEIADKLKAELEAHHATKQEQLAKLSRQIRERWTNHERREPIAYKLACLQTVASRLGQTRLEAQQEMSVLRPGINEFPLKTAISLSRSIWDLGEKQQRQDGESVLLPVLVRMGLEGPKLGPKEDFVNYIDQLIDEYGDPEESYDWQAPLQSLARDLNFLRETSPNGMIRFWSSFAGKGEVTMRTIANGFAFANVGKYDPNSVQIERRWNTGALDLMKFLSSEAYVRTTSILACDACSLPED